MEVTFFDVGQGDSIFIESSQGHQILIDGGPDDQVLNKLAEEMPFWDRTIDLVVLTHPEHDHFAGLLEVFKRYEVENILWTGIVRDTAEYKEWVKLIEKERVEDGAKIHIAHVGQEIYGVSGGQSSAERRTVLRILYPSESLEGEKIENSNNTSIVARLVFGETSFLFTGDAYKSVERELLNQVKQQPGVELDSDVLKVGHHGSKTSSCKEFIEVVSPEIAVIQCGRDNFYGHPNSETLENLGGVKIFRTDLDGDIKIVSDGSKITESFSR